MINQEIFVLININISVTSFFSSAQKVKSTDLSRIGFTLILITYSSILKIYNLTVPAIFVLLNGKSSIHSVNSSRGV